MGHPYIRRKRKERQNRTQFAALIETPETGAFVMPAGGKLRFVATAGASEGDPVATLTGTSERNIESPELEADGYVVVDWVERGVEVDAESGFNVQVDMGLGVWSTIAEIA